VPTAEIANVVHQEQGKGENGDCDED